MALKKSVKNFTVGGSDSQHKKQNIKNVERNEKKKHAENALKN